MRGKIFQECLGDVKLSFGVVKKFDDSVYRSDACSLTSDALFAKQSIFRRRYSREEIFPNDGAVKISKAGYDVAACAGKVGGNSR
jgi:hypothetical protein